MLVYQHTTQLLYKTEFLQQRSQSNQTYSINQEENPRNSIDFVVTTLAGAWAGILSWVCVIPFDVVKTIIQAEENRNCRSIRHCLIENYRVSQLIEMIRFLFITS